MAETSKILSACRPVDRTISSVQGRQGRGWIALIDTWRQRSRDRRALMAMSDNELKDIGLKRYDAHYEARKPFWRA